jgi:hemolysin III
MKFNSLASLKPIARGYIHKTAFFIALAACAILIAQSHTLLSMISNIIYSLTLTGLYGVSALYHSHWWSRRNYLLIKSIDHAAIFALIAGTATPICLLGLRNESGWLLFFVMWTFATIGMYMSVFWIHGPKWVRAFFYVAIGWLGFYYFSEIKSSLGEENTWLLLVGGIIYTVGALIYAFKRPDPFPQVFGYHALFHIFVVVASGFHFKVIYSLAV